MAGLCVLLAACNGGPSEIITVEKPEPEIDPKYGVAPSPRVVETGSSIPKGGGRYMVGKPYTIAGKRYVPREQPDYRETGMASWYGAAFHGRKTANGEIFDKESITAAHTTLPLPSYVRVTNRNNGRSMTVRVNDRGPFHGNRVIDLSERVAEMLDFKSDGIAKVHVEYLGRADVDGSDDEFLIASLAGPGVTPNIMVADAGARPAHVGIARHGGERQRGSTTRPAGTVPQQAPISEASGIIVASVPGVPVPLDRPFMPAPQRTTVAAFDPADAVGTGSSPSFNEIQVATNEQPNRQRRTRSQLRPLALQDRSGSTTSSRNQPFSLLQDSASIDSVYYGTDGSRVGEGNSANGSTPPRSSETRPIRSEPGPVPPAPISFATVDRITSSFKHFEAFQETSVPLSEMTTKP